MDIDYIFAAIGGDGFVQQLLQRDCSDGALYSHTCLVTTEYRKPTVRSWSYQISPTSMFTMGFIVARL